MDFNIIAFNIVNTQWSNSSWNHSRDEWMVGVSLSNVWCDLY